LSADINKGVAFVRQKNNVISLKLLADITLNDGSLIKAGSKAFFSEEVIYNNDYYSKPISNVEIMKVPFVIGDLGHVIGFSND
jgi:hypothetical protein